MGPKTLFKLLRPLTNLWKRWNWVVGRDKSCDYQVPKNFRASGGELFSLRCSGLMLKVLCLGEGYRIVGRELSIFRSGLGSLGFRAPSTQLWEDGGLLESCCQVSNSKVSKHHLKLRADSQMLGF